MEGSESALVAGYRLDRYELLCPIASGGMASVWLARLRGKRGFEKLFAIKTIKTELISDAHFQEMFMDEARIASRIIHPNVAQILELGEQDDILYIVMEYVDGDSLAKINRLANKRGSPLPPGVSMRIVAEMCAGLHAAHQLKDAEGESLGVVHRDVSPQNVLVTTSGQAKVIDFGLVKARNRSAAETETGVVKGKIRYMAPEQVSTKQVDHRADIWAAGMCLYELITGHPPYHEEEDLDVVKRLMSSDPLPSFHVALPPQIEKILTRAIVTDRNARFESCAAMRRAIESAIQELGLTSENDDVAEFVNTTLPELGTKRKKTIEKAILASDARPTSSASTPPPRNTVPDALESGDMAFANTEVSARDPNIEAALPLTRRQGQGRIEKESLDSDPRILSSDGGRTPSATTLRDQLGEQKKRGGAGFVLAGLAVIGTATWILFPRAASTPVTPTAAVSAASASATPPTPEVEASATSSDASTIELDPALALALADAAPAASTALITDAGAPRLSTTSSGSPRPRTTWPSGGPPSLAVQYDGGLSPGARSAAAIMLAPRPTETPPEEPAPAPRKAP
jgi:eukaryotic-like serine/threonine-protein kinase